MARGGKRPGAGRKPKQASLTRDEVMSAADRAEGLNYSEQPRGRGQPTSYRDISAKQAKKMCELGATDLDLAEAFGVTVRTIANWRVAHTEFFQAVKDGKDVADDRVERSLYQRAVGYSHDAVKIMTVSDGHAVGSHVEHVPYVEHFPPETTAAIFWLKNRRPDLWRDKQVHEHGGIGGGPIRAITSTMSAEEAADAYAATLHGDPNDVAPELH